MNDKDVQLVAKIIKENTKTPKKKRGKYLIPFLAGVFGGLIADKFT